MSLFLQKQQICPKQCVFIGQSISSGHHNNINFAVKKTTQEFLQDDRRLNKDFAVEFAKEKAEL